MRILRNVLGLALLFVALTIVLIVVLGNSIDRDRDASLGSSNSNPGSEPTATITQLPPDVTLTRATVERVSDGDTIRVRIGNSVESLRLIGIDAPETATSYASDCLAEDARDYLSRLVDGKTVYLETDVNDRDQYNRLLRYVWLPKGDGYVMVNQLIVGRGLAKAHVYGGDDKHASTLARTELDAINRHVGIWGACISSSAHGVAGAPDFWDGSSDLDCGDFATRVNAQAFYAAEGGPGRDPHNLDVDRNGLVCHGLPPTEPRG
jgi:micrococcal nuclease